MFEGLFVKVCSDYLSRNNKRKLPLIVLLIFKLIVARQMDFVNTIYFFQLFL